MAAAVGGMVLLEHVNINVGDWDVTQRFHEALGCQQAQKPIHMNCGALTQFHMPVEAPVQVWRGEITIAYTARGLAAAHERLAALAKASDGRKIELSKKEDACISVKDMWGNQLLLREAKPEEAAMAAVPSKRPNVSETVAQGVVGIVAVSLPVQLGQAAKLASFYKHVFGFQTSIGDGEASVLGGPVPGSQRIIFREVADVPAYTGDHFAIYIGDFEGTFVRCAERELLYVNPRFTHLDDSRTLEQARHWQAFRIMEAKGDDALLLREEHEIRSLDHKFNPLARAPLER
mmetsp:Transcript_100709/g.260151  ORF Transcript_100709/g.260151 Transcript_100709/m.260151 type:complete len:290 (-) Transcript_100709:164-1033(-)